ncbi:unnamed protein product [Polarella glacialis]|uniref:Deacetylase sirtuin-type domain-containing protein n=1 Tax=Polarella glacialis TaxID=89957 RepID=A0A813GP42_POLGL|nr:unnamed protein product [Polarella glacialis]
MDSFGLGWTSLVATAAGSLPVKAPANGASRAKKSLPEKSRDEVCAQLRNGFVSHDHQLFMHGRIYSGPVEAASVLWKSDKPPRKDHNAPRWLTATEFEDTEAVMEAKCEELANLLRISKKTVLYTGAGISASVIGQAALSGQNKVGWKPDKMSANPTPTHYALGLLGQQGIIHSWVQQNHDGLPQKAGFPQELINEIHGSWYDPSNPVVKYCGCLHDRSFPWMEDDAETADLVLVLGTSLGGLTADQVATNAAQRSKKPAGALGTVCINLQQTALDGEMTLRLFGKSDKLLAVLLRKLGLQQPRPEPMRWPTMSRALVPYDADGRRLPAGCKKKMWLDFSDGQKVRLTKGHNVQGAKQPQYMHIHVGLGCVIKRDQSTCSFSLQIEGASMRLGIWWLEAAMIGSVDVFPLVNESPRFGQDEDEDARPPGGAPASGKREASSREQTLPKVVNKPRKQALPKGRVKGPVSGRPSE